MHLFHCGIYAQWLDNIMNLFHCGIYAQWLDNIINLFHCGLSLPNNEYRI